MLVLLVQLELLTGHTLISSPSASTAASKLGRIVSLNPQGTRKDTWLDELSIQPKLMTVHWNFN